MVLVLLTAMAIAAVTDAVSGEIPVWLFPGALAITVIWWVLSGIPAISTNRVLGAAALFIPVLVLCLAGKMGGGDLIMFTVTGFLLGFYLLPAYMFWFGCAALIQVACMKVLHLLRHKTGHIMDAEVPIAPIAAGAYIILIIRGYLCIQ